MRYCILIILLFLSGALSAKIDIAPSCIDERFEFVNLVVHYADMRQGEASPYLSFADKHLVKETGVHPLFYHLDYLKQKYALNPQSLLSASLSWQITNGVLQQGEERNRLQQLLTADDYDELINQLNKYYRHIKFAEFFESQRFVYNKAKELYDRDVLSKLKMSFFDGYSADLSVTPYISLLSPQGHNVIDDAKAVAVNVFAFPVIACHTDVSSLQVYVNTIVESDVIYRLLCAVSLLSCADAGADNLPVALGYYKSAMLLFEKAGVSVDKVVSMQMSQLIALSYIDKYYPVQLGKYIVYDKQCGFIWENELYDAFKQYHTSHSGHIIIDDLKSELVSQLKSFINLGV